MPIWCTKAQQIDSDKTICCGSKIRWKGVVSSRSVLIEQLREQIVGAMHVGQLHAGDRLPSIREVAARLHRNPRTVKAAYDALEKEHLVEVRGRSGVFVARQEVLAGEMPAEIGRWLTIVLTEAWQRRITVSSLPQLLERIASTRMVCAFIDDVEDTVVAIRYELESEWGMDVRIVAPDAIHEAHGVDFLAATSFRAQVAHEAAEQLGLPFVVITSHAALQQAIRGKLESGGLTVVAVDPGFGERIRVAYVNESNRDNFRVVLASDAEAVAKLDLDRPVLLTRAARQRLGSVSLPMIYPHSPTISLETARVLAALLIRRSLASERPVEKGVLIG